MNQNPHYDQTGRVREVEVEESHLLEPGIRNSPTGAIPRS